MTIRTTKMSCWRWCLLVTFPWSPTTGSWDFVDGDDDSLIVLLLPPTFEESPVVDEVEKAHLFTKKFKFCQDDRLQIKKRKGWVRYMISFMTPTTPLCLSNWISCCPAFSISYAVCSNIHNHVTFIRWSSFRYLIQLFSLIGVKNTRHLTCHDGFTQEREEWTRYCTGIQVMHRCCWQKLAEQRL